MKSINLKKKDAYLQLTFQAQIPSPSTHADTVKGPTCVDTAFGCVQGANISDALVNICENSIYVNLKHP